MLPGDALTARLGRVGLTYTAAAAMMWWWWRMVDRSVCEEKRGEGRQAREGKRYVCRRKKNYTTKHVLKM